MGTDISSLDPASILLITANLVLILIAVFLLIRLRRKQKLDESEKEKRPEPAGIAEIKPEVPVLESVPAVLAQKGESIKPETEPFSWIAEPLPEKAEFEQKIPETQTAYQGSMPAQSYDESESKDELFSNDIEDSKPEDSESLVVEDENEFKPGDEVPKGEAAAQQQITELLEKETPFLTGIDDTEPDDSESPVVEDESEPVPEDEVPEADAVVLQQIKEQLEKEAFEPFSIVGEGRSESTVVQGDDELKLEDEVPEEAFVIPQKETLPPPDGIKPEENELELEDEVPEIADAADIESIKETQVHEDQEKIEEKTEKKKRETLF